MAWHLARSLETLRSQINTQFPKRSKVSDGTIGDTAHAARKSDHNPNSADAVCALDITHDLDGKGDDFHSWQFADMILAKQDPRLSYVISNGRIGSGPTGKQPGVWRKYDGKNKHAHHVHISAVNELNGKLRPDLYDDPRPWDLDFAAEAREPPPAVAPPPGVSDELRDRMVEWILNAEARFDAQGRVQVYRPGDGSYEVGGVNSAHHPEEAARLKGLVEAGRHDEAKRGVMDFALKFTRPAAGWHTDPGVEFYLRDSIYNRGVGGGAKILQMAVGVPVDGEIGHQTRAAMERLAPADLLTRLRAAREAYEDATYGARPNLRRGLTNRWNNALKFARELQGQGAQLERSTRWIQESLNALIASPDLQPLDVDGSLGPATRERLALFQTETGLEPDGLPDPETVAEIERHLAKPAEPAGAPSAPAPSGAAPPQPSDDRSRLEALDDTTRAFLKGLFGRN